ncbi:hypothetical protein GNY06_10690 [Elizabethkingia argentiflava]|uniref:Uncharacterized protein n=1 Tax=Elizabethkingia argenteiflava TaxID=2681556 RepID=A0A845PZF0_9FLAO|nr:hypothetical protein [Elizabethkingia argenteiflava]NAW51817.1 hypothetical protein [Elizabethkingia argenteiflava]
MSSFQLYGINTPSRMGGEKLGYQGRKRQKPPTAFFCVISVDLCWICVVHSVGFLTIYTY